MTPPALVARPVVAAFSRRVRSLRLAARITQNELADRAHVRRVFISLIERGKANPSLVTIALIAAALGCRVTELFGDERQSQG
jgi:transcriptional regulator with XRE-family HTH domain